MRELENCIWYVRSKFVACPLLICSQLAKALVDHETLNLEEVKKVVKGEPIRNITDILEEDVPNLQSESS